MRRLLLSILSLVLCVSMIFGGISLAHLKLKHDKNVAEAKLITDDLKIIWAECGIYETNPNFGTNCEKYREDFISNEEAIEYNLSVAGRPVDEDGFFMDDPNYIHFQKPENVVFEVNGKLINGYGDVLGDANTLNYEEDLYGSDDLFVPDRELDENVEIPESPSIEEEEPDIEEDLDIENPEDETDNENEEDADNSEEDLDAEEPSETKCTCKEDCNCGCKETGECNCNHEKDINDVEEDLEEPTILDSDTENDIDTNESETEGNPEDEEEEETPVKPEEQAIPDSPIKEED